jgi:hypothetical protein
MRWNSAHVGNIRQAPDEGQEGVNPDIKVPDEQNPLVEDEELEPAPTRRDADPKDPKTPKEPVPTAHAVEARDKDTKDRDTKPTTGSSSH